MSNVVLPQEAVEDLGKNTRNYSFLGPGRILKLSYIEYSKTKFKILKKIFFTTLSLAPESFKMWFDNLLYRYMCCHDFPGQKHSNPRFYAYNQQSNSHDTLKHT